MYPTMMNIDRGKNVLTSIRIIRDVKSCFNKEEVIVAGGAARDDFLQKEVRDFDIYMARPEAVDIDMVKMFLENEEWACNVRSIKPQISDEFLSYNDTLIEDVFAFDHKYENKPCELIVLQPHLNPINYVQEAFVCNLSKIWIEDDIHNPRFHVDFVDAVMHKKLKFYWGYHTDVNLEYVKKIANKYPEYELDEDTLDLFHQEWTREVLWK